MIDGIVDDNSEEAQVSRTNGPDDTDSPEMSDAHRRMWADDAVMQVVDPAAVRHANVRFSDEALDVLRFHGTETYEAYIAEHTPTTPEE